MPHNIQELAAIFIVTEVARHQELLNWWLTVAGPTKFLKMKYSLSDAFTASAEKNPILRLGDGATRFRIISDTFVQCFSCQVARGSF